MYLIETSLILSVVIVLISLFPIVKSLLKSTDDHFDPRFGFLVYIAIQLGVYPIYVELTDNDYFYINKESVGSRYFLNMALVYACLGIVVFSVAFLWFKRLGMMKNNVVFIVRRNMVVPVGFMVLTISLYAFYSCYLEGGFSSYVDNFSGLRYGTVEKNQMLYFLCTLFPANMAVLLGYHLSNTKMKWGLPQILLALLIAVSVISSVLTGFRAVMAPVIITLAASYNYTVKRLNTKTLLVGLAAFVALNALYGAVRQGFEANKTFDEKVDSSAITKLLLRSSALDVTSVIIQKIDSGAIEHAGLLPGLYETASMLIPRKMWANKPVPQGIIFSEVVFNQPNGGISMSVIGYLYYQSGIIFVLLGMFMLGCGMAFLRGVFFGNRLCAAVNVIYVVFLGLAPKVAEAPQETLNQIVISSASVAVILLFTTIPTARQSDVWHRQT